MLGQFGHVLHVILQYFLIWLELKVWYSSNTQIINISCSLEPCYISWSLRLNIQVSCYKYFSSLKARYSSNTHSSHWLSTCATLQHMQSYKIESICIWLHQYKIYKSVHIYSTFVFTVMLHYIHDRNNTCNIFNNYSYS